MIIAKRESSAKQSGAEPNVGGSPLAADSSDTCRAGGDPGSARGSRAAGTTEVAAWGARGPQLPGARAPPVRDHVTRAARVGIAAAAGRSSLRETRASRRGPGPPARSVWRHGPFCAGGPAPGCAVRRHQSWQSQAAPPYSNEPAHCHQPAAHLGDRPGFCRRRLRLIPSQQHQPQVVFVSLWPVSSPCHSSGHWLLHDAGCNVLQHLDFPRCGPGLGCGLLPSLPTSPPGLAGEGFAGTQGWRELGTFFQALHFSGFFSWWPFLTSFSAPGKLELKPALVPWSSEATEATLSSASLHRAWAYSGALRRLL
ncbi:probable low affinity copper uptake protein 2 isoform X1 [Marmota marmota marmota]|uniref:probable low affinity copper uptake protein 2 isoform X1 n=1 Tax=Marmota marmota marmota TaxID=9994 RepID=UPI0020934DBE|nr:probable low affinity copper uptake protein 2 isoform X1 [Marmota marmota marmota]